MDVKEVFYNGAKIELLSINTDEIKSIYEVILKHNVPIYRIKKDDSIVVIPPLKLNQFLGKDEISSTIFYIEKEWYEERIQNVDLKDEEIDSSLDKELKVRGTLQKNIEKFQNMPMEDRVKILDNNLQKIKDDTKKNKHIGTVELLGLVESVIDTFCLNKVTIEENVKSLLSKESLQMVIEKTKLLVEAIVLFLQQENVKYNDLNQLEKVKTESDILDHMHKVMLRFIPFCIFYNEYFSDGLISSFRAKFKQKYLQYYQKLMPEVDVTLERVYYRGMRRLTLEEMKEYALGAIFHDIGKDSKVQYHEWENTYDRSEAIKHTAYALKLLMATKELPFSVVLVATLHHEYYGHKDGYNMSNLVIPNYNQMLQEKKVDYFITYSSQDLLSHNAMSYFPCKVLEIIDIFDNLFLEKFGKENFLTIADLLAYMKENFIEKDFKIDPILFTIFMEFAKHYEGLPDPDAVRHLKF